MQAEVFLKAQSGSSRSFDGDRITLEDPSVVHLQVGPELVARYERSGNDLVLVLKDGTSLVIENFFVVTDEERSDLVLEDADGVTWWAQYGEVWDGFDIAEIDQDVPAALLAFAPSILAGVGLVVGGVTVVVDDDDPSAPLDPVPEPDPNPSPDPDPNPTPDPEANNPPEASADPVITPEDTPVDGVVTGSDKDGDDLTYEVIKEPEHGKVTMTPDGSYIYTPDKDYNGPDSFDVIVDDGNGGKVTVTVPITVTPINDPPVGAADPITTPEDTPIDGLVTGTDVDGDELTFRVVDGSGPEHGRVTMTPDGRYTYTPDRDYNGPDSFDVIVDDGNGGTDIVTVPITVTPVNDLPRAVPDTNTVDEDTPATGNVLRNDNDPDGDRLTVTSFEVDGNTHNPGGSVDIPDIGTITIGSDGSYTFTPVPDWNGTVPTITYTISDGDGGTTTSTLDIEVTPVEDIVVDEVTTHSGVPITTDVLDNDTFENDDAKVTEVTQGDNGTVTINEDGTITYTPNEGYVGEDSYEYTVTSGGKTETTTVTVNVENKVPGIEPETETTEEDTPLSGNVLENDSDPDGDELSVTEFTINSTRYTAGEEATITGVGTITIDENGDYTFTPVPDWNGKVPTVTYSISDGNDGGTATSTLDIEVTPVEDIVVDEVTTHAGDPVTTDVLDNDTFENDDAKVTEVTQGEHGTVEINEDGTVTYTPNDGYVGEDSYTYTVTSGGKTETTTVTVSVENDPPQPEEDSDIIDEDTSATGNVLENDNDPDGDPLTVISFEVGGNTYNPGDTAEIPDIGTITIGENGNYTFTPVDNWNGKVPTVTYTVSDGNNDGERSSTLDIEVTPVNDVPEGTIVPDDQDSKDADTVSGVNVSGYFSDPDGDTLIYSADGLPEGLSINETTGEIIGTIDKSASQGGTDGVYTVTITASDGNGGEAEQSFQWTVTNPAPVASEDAGTTDEDTVLSVDASGGVLSNDNDPDGDNLSVSQVNGDTANVGMEVDGSNGGVFTLKPDGSYDFDPNGEFEDLAVNESRTTSITYTVSDGEGGTDTATLTVTVNGVNDAPLPEGTQIPAQTNQDADTGISLDVSGYFSDPDGDTLIYSADGLPEGLSINETTGEIIGTIDKSASQGGDNNDGIHEVTITADDGNGGTVDQTFTWAVTNPAPTANPDTGTVTEDGAALEVSAEEGVISGTSNSAGMDTDPDGDTLEVTKVVKGEVSDESGFEVETAVSAGSSIDGEYGKLTLNADGSYKYELNNDDAEVNALGEDDTLQDVFSYAISDGEGGTAFTTLTITINGNNDGEPTVTPVDENGETEDGELTVYESGLTGNGPNGESAVASGTITLSAGNGLASVTIAGTVVTLEQLENLSSSPININTPQGTLSLTGYSSSSEVGGVSTGGSLSYTYTLEEPVDNPDAASSNHIETITLSVEDAAGQTDDSTLNINIIDDEPSIDAPDAVVLSEANLNGGTAADPDELTQSGSLKLRTGADDDGFDTQFDATQTAPTGLTSNGEAVTYSFSGDGHTLTASANGTTVFTVTLTNPGTTGAGYDFNLSGPLDHTEGADLELSFEFTATDADDDAVSGSFDVTIKDDGPIAVNPEPLSLAEGGETVTYDDDSAPNLLANVTAGGDGQLWISDFTYTDEAGDEQTVDIVVIDDIDFVEVDTQYGTLTVSRNGDWTYYTDDTEDNLDGVTESFTYTIVDADGSSVTAEQELTVTDTNPEADDIELSIDEANIPETGSDPQTSNEVTQELDISKGPDDISDVIFDNATITGLQSQNLTSGGTELVYSIGDGGHRLTATAGGETIFTLTFNNPTDDSGESQSVTMSLVGALDHAEADGNNELSIDVDYVVKDIDSEITASMELTVTDDMPVPGADEAAVGPVLEGGESITFDDDENPTPNLLANDTQGADGARVYQIRYTDADGEPAEGTVGASGSTFTTIHGSLTVQQDGSWSYTTNPASDTEASVEHPKSTHDEQIDDVFEYNLIDADGDISDWSSQTITIKDTVPEIGTPDDATVDEANLASGSNSNPDNAPVEATGSLAVTKAADAIDVTFDDETISTLEDRHITSGSVELVYTISNEGHTLTAKAGNTGPVIFTATITTPTTAPAGYSVVLSGPLDSGGSENSRLPISYTVTDADGDSVSSQFDFIVVDDRPAENLSFTMDEDSEGVTFNTSADSTGDNISYTSPAYGTVQINADGSISYEPQGNYSGEDRFSYTVTADDGTPVTTEVILTIKPVSDAPDLGEQEPDPGSDVNRTINTNEDEPIALGLTVPTATDNTDQNQNENEDGDNPELLGEITLSGIPAGAQLLDGNGNSLFPSTGDSITIQLTDEPNEGPHIAGLITDLTMDMETYEALQVLPPPDHHENFTVEVSVTSYEVEDDRTPITNVDGVESSASIEVRVQAVTDPVELGLVDGDDTRIDHHTINEDESFNLTALLSVNFPTSEDESTGEISGPDMDGSETRWFEIRGLPIGSKVTIDGVGTIITADTPVATNKDTPWNPSEPGASLPVMIVTPPANFSGDINDITITLKSQDHDSDGPTADGDVKEASVTLNLHVMPVADDVEVDPVEGDEDTAIAFLTGVRLSDVSTDDNEGGTELITEISFEVPTGWTVTPSSVTNGATATAGLSGTTYTITFTGGTEAEREAYLDGFTITPPGHSSSDAKLTLTISTQDQSFVEDETETATATEEYELTVTVNPVAEEVETDTDGDGTDDLTLTPGHDYVTAGKEDTWFDLNIEGFDLGDGWSNQDSSSEQTFARLTPELIEGDGTYADAIGSRFQWDGGEAVFSGEPIDVPVDALDSLQFLAAKDFSGRFTIKVEAYTVDSGEDASDTLAEAVSGEAKLINILIEPVADEVTLSLEARTQGKEDTPIPLLINPTSSDPSEVFEVTIENIPEGAKLFYDGTELEIIDGKVIIENFDSTLQLELIPPENSNEDFSLSVTAKANDILDIDGGHYEDSSSTTLDMDIELKGVADEAKVDVTSLEYVESELDAELDSVALADLFTVTPLDNDGSETPTVRITGLPEGFNLLGGTVLLPTATGEERTWVLTESQLANAEITVPQNFNGTVNFDVIPVTTENDGSSLTGVATPVSFSVTPSPEATVTERAVLVEDVITSLNFGVVHQNGDEDEELAGLRISVDDVEDVNFTLFIGEEGAEVALADAGLPTIDGYYELTVEQAAQLSARGAEHLDGELGGFDLLYQITDPGNDGLDDVTSDWQSGRFELEATPVTDQLELTVDDISNGTTTEESNNFTVTAPGDVVTVNLDVDTPDSDGSEHVIRVIVTGVPDGVIVNGGQALSGTDWLLVFDGPDALPVDNNGHIDLPVSFTIGNTAAGLDNVPIEITVQIQDRGYDPSFGTEILSDTVTWNLTTTFEPEGEIQPAIIEAWEYTEAGATEDTAFTLSEMINGEVGVSPDTPPETLNTLTITITDVPAGAEIAGMTRTTINGEDVWTASVTTEEGEDAQAALDELMDSIIITPPVNINDNSLGEDGFSFNATLTTSIPGGLRSNSEDVTPEIPVEPVADPAEVVIALGDADTDGTLTESDSDIPLSLTVNNAADGEYAAIVDGTLYLQIGGSNGLEDGTLIVDGVTYATQEVSGITDIPDGDYYVITGVEMGETLDMVFTPNTMTEGELTVDALIRNTETGAAEAITSNGSVTLPVAMSNDGVSFTPSDVEGSEALDTSTDHLIELDLSSLSLNDNDGSETITSILLSNLPDGFLLYTGNSAGDASMSMQGNNAGGSNGLNTWIVSDGELPAYVGILPPKYWSGTLDDLSLIVTSGETSMSESRVDEVNLGSVTITPVANGLTLDTTNSFGLEGDIIALNLNASMADSADASEEAAEDTSLETTTLELTGLGEHAAFYIGDTLITSGVNYDAGNDTYTLSGLSQADLDALGFQQAAAALTDQDAAAGVQIGITARTVDGADVSDDVSSTATINLREQLPTGGDNELIWTGEAIDARGGEDTVKLRYGESLNGSDLADNLSNVEVISLEFAGSNAITGLTPEQLAAMTDVDNVLTISGTAEDSVSLSGDWSDNGDGTYTGILDDESEVTLTISGAVSVQAPSGGFVTLAEGDSSMAIAGEGAEMQAFGLASLETDAAADMDEVSGMSGMDEEQAAETTDAGDAASAVDESSVLEEMPSLVVDEADELPEDEQDSEASAVAEEDEDVAEEGLIEEDLAEETEASDEDAAADAEETDGDATEAAADEIADFGLAALDNIEESAANDEPEAEQPSLDDVLSSDTGEDDLLAALPEENLGAETYTQGTDAGAAVAELAGSMPGTALEDDLQAAVMYDV